MKMVLISYMWIELMFHMFHWCYISSVNCIWDYSWWKVLSVLHKRSNFEVSIENYPYQSHRINTLWYTALENSSDRKKNNSGRRV